MLFSDSLSFKCERICELDYNLKLPPYPIVPPSRLEVKHSRINTSKIGGHVFFQILEPAF